MADKTYTVPFTAVVTASVSDDHDAATERSALRQEHATTLRATLAPALRAARAIDDAGAAGAGTPLEVQLERSLRANPHLAAMMKRAGITAADVRKHGPTEWTVVPNLRELAEGTSARESEERKSK